MDEDSVGVSAIQFQISASNILTPLVDVAVFSTDNGQILLVDFRTEAQFLLCDPFLEFLEFFELARLMPRSFHLAR